MKKEDRKLTKKRTGKPPLIVLGIDPGISGAIVATNGVDYIEVYLMPISEGTVCFSQLKDIFGTLRSQVDHVFVERAVSFGMGTKSAFSYGRSFEALVLAVEHWHFPHTLVEPGKWAKEMHAGISKNLKPKAKSLIAVRRLFPKLLDCLPAKPKGALKDGPVDALLIAGYGLRLITPPGARVVPEADFF